MTGTGPLRTCAVCRKVVAQEELLRFVLLEDVAKSEWRIELDVERVMDGRGAHCHPRKECLLASQFAEKILGSLLCRGKRKLGGSLLREPFEAILRRAQQVELPQAQKKKGLSLRAKKDLERLASLLRPSEEGKSKLSRAPKLKIRM